MTAPSCETENAVCQACIDVNESLPYWNGESCVSCATGTSDESNFFDPKGKACMVECSLTYDGNNVCRTCAELDEKKPFWSGSECTAACPDE